MSLQFSNDGPTLIASNFWESDMAAAGKFFLTINSGAFRLLVPAGCEQAIPEMRTGKEVVVSRGPWPARHRDDALELMFDDGSDNPYAVHLGIESIDRLPLDDDATWRWVCTVWTRPRRGVPHRALSIPAWYRRVASIPCLEPREREVR